MGPGTIGLLISAMAVAGIPVLFVAGFIMDRFGRKFTIVPALLSMGAALLLIASISWLLLPAPFFIGAYVWLQLSASLMGGSMQTMGTDIAPANARGKFFGVSRLVGEAGSLSNPVSFAILSSLASFAAAFLFRGAMSLAAGAVFMLLVKETLQKAKPDEQGRT